MTPCTAGETEASLVLCADGTMTCNDIGNSTYAWQTLDGAC